MKYTEAHSWGRGGFGGKQLDCEARIKMSLKNEGSEIEPTLNNLLW